jgi:hypothetical protein
VLELDQRIGARDQPLGDPKRGDDAPEHGSAEDQALLDCVRERPELAGRSPQDAERQRPERHSEERCRHDGKAADDHGISERLGTR